jgi:hypothetical protein
MEMDRSIAAAQMTATEVQPVNIVAQVQPESITYQPKQDVGKWLDFVVTGDGTRTAYPLSSNYLNLYRGYVINGVEVIQTAGTPNISNVQSIRLNNRRIDGQDDAQVTVVDLTRYKSDALSNETKIIARGLRFPVDHGTFGCAFDSSPSLVFSTAPANTQSYLVRMYVEKIVGKENFI